MAWFWPIGRPKTIRFPWRNGPPYRPAARPIPIPSAAIRIAFGLRPSRRVTKPRPFFADYIRRGDLQIVDKQHVGIDRMAAKLVQFTHLDRIAIEVGEEERHAIGLFGDLLDCVVRVSRSIFLASCALVMKTLRPLMM